jgi:hypothetical protein
MYSGQSWPDPGPLTRENGGTLAGRFVRQSSRATHTVPQEHQMAVVPEGLDTA